ncbi:prepilin peptidase [Novispirillum sp. DQ9]|uniref:prepilin peptidase n=1 Tax=Novispirillum sp. DQ9 TaxID=3398612 RepID=UPI003C7B6AD0
MALAAWAGLPPGLVLALAALLGLVAGSFLSALTWRLPRGGSVARGRSACVRCGEPLRARDLVPVLSWLAARGRCRACGGAISPRYPLIEGATAALFAAIALRAATPEAAIALAALGAVLMALAVVDLEHGLLPDVLNLAAVAPALAVRWLSDGDVVAGVVGGIAAGLAAWGLKAGFRAATGRDGLGWGDVKFLAVAGILLRPWEWPPFLLLAGGLGVALGLAWRAAGRGAEFPFGPALIAALLALLLVPDLAGVFEPAL